MFHRSLNRQKLLGWLKTKLPMYIIMMFFVFLALIPLVYSLNTSLKSESEFVDSPIAMVKDITLENYVYAFTKAKMAIYLRNSIIVVPLALIFYLVICSMAGFAFGRLRFPGRIPIFLLVLFMMIFPQIIIASQVYLICIKLRLVNNYLGLILVWVSYFSLFGTYIMSTYYATVPKELMESAKIDGASIYQIMFRIMLPIGRPMLVTLAIIGFRTMWSELPFSLLLLVKDSMRTVTLGIAMMKGEHGIHMVKLTAGVMIAMFIPLVVYLVFQKYLQIGVTAGSVKG